MVGKCKLSWALFMAIASVAVAQDTPGFALGDDEDVWGGCVDYNRPDALVTIGEPSAVCLVIGDGADWSTRRTYMRLHFLPKADEYSRFHVPDSFQNLVLDENTRVTQIYDGKNITIHAASQTS